MDIATVDDQVLAGGVCGLGGRKQEDSSRGDFRRQRHAMAEGNLVRDVLQFGVGIPEGIEPASVEGRHDFSRKHGVDADVVGEQLRGPLAGQRELRTFARGIAGGVALTGERNLGADVHDGALCALERRQREVGERVAVDKVLVQALNESLDAAILQAGAVVDAGMD